jgi:Na+/melibiose symporter-like transporter
MITQETHRIDWNKTAHIAGVVLVALAKAAWWLAKHGWALVVATLAVLAKVFVAIVSVWASTPEVNDDDRYTKPGELGYNDAGEPGFGPEHRYKKFS